MYKVDEIRLGFIGLGRRGKVLLKNILDLREDVSVVAGCDLYPDRVDDFCALVKEKRGAEPKGYASAAELFADSEVNTVIISASWEAHVPLAIASMRAGKITGLEVGGAYSLDDCFALVEAYRETGTPFMFLENCCFGKNELLVTNLVRKGLFGEVVYGHGAYCHDLREQIASGAANRHYRLRNYLARNCENYPTHELGPLAKILNVNRGNRMLTLSSVATKARGMSAFVRAKGEPTELLDKTFMQGDVVCTNITCADGSVISLKLDTTLPHFYSREFTVCGTKGMFKEDGNVAFIDGKDNHKDGMSLHYNSANDYHEEYLPSEWKTLTKQEMEAGHDGMDTLTLKAFFRCARSGEEMPIDVFDAAAWMAVTCLSETSIQMGGAPVEIPDFTSGEWVLREPRDVVDFK